MRYFAVHVLTLRILEIILLKPKNFLTCPSIFSILFHFNVSTYSKQSFNLVFVPSYKIWPTFLQDKVKTSRPPVFVPIETNVTPTPFWSGDHVAVVASVMTCTCAAARCRSVSVRVPKFRHVCGGRYLAAAWCCCSCDGGRSTSHSILIFRKIL